MKIAFLTQLEYRDRLLDERIASHLRKMGHTVGVGNFVFYGREFVLKSQPDIIVIPECRCEHTVDFVEAVEPMGVRVAIRRCEASLGFEGFKKADQSYRNIILGRWPYYADIELCWSTESEKVINDWPNALGKNAHWCGAFTFDHYFPLPKRVKGEKKTVLFASTWDYATRDPEYSIPEAPTGDPIHIEAHEKCRAGKDIWLEEIERTLKDYPDWHVIIKPHPAEDYLEYAKCFGKRVEISKNIFAYKVLPRADVLIHAGSSMALEANLMGIPAYRLSNFIEDHPILDVSPEITKVELNKFDIGKSNADIPTIKILEDTFFGPIDGKACERAAKWIDRLSPCKKNIPKVWPESKRDYSMWGVEKKMEPGMLHRDIIQCCCCKRTVYVSPAVNLAKCPYCSIMLGRKSAPGKPEWS